MSTPGSNELRIDAGVFVAVVFVGVTVLIFIVIAWIFGYHVLKDREARKKEMKRRAAYVKDVERGCDKAELELPAEYKIAELEQPGTPELDSKEVRELWVEGCAEEMDAGLGVVELQAEECEVERDGGR
ncbi:hypothetical protein BU26DRAFT_127133 [Trematosphaeria pertusa]|uniref:Uncharacterized protein n=1 Tax=Trematosphaeria pertusa TaxID=390896 RepID=A0A6A6I0Q1_9PLEO|nr:uncharacterized protein BU26DRAFT_127133 [Trematosphaeria pertusa]KAF2243150.1 hypothetical protein BU26DRAFT_127133 [Trematosphaeria pertusa]